MDKPSTILSALAISAMGALFYNVLPMYLGAAQEELLLGNRAIGLISVAFFLGYNAATISAFFWIRLCNWRIVALIAVPVAVISLYCGAVVGGYRMLLVFTSIAGAAFAVLYGLGTTIIGDTSNPARWFGAKIAAEAAPGAILLLVLPTTLIPRFGIEGLVIGIIASIVLMLPALAGLPARGNKRSASNQASSSNSYANGKLTVPPPLTIWFRIVGVCVFFSGASSMWAFIERIGNAREIPAGALGNLLSLTLLTAVIGSLIAAWLGNRLGNIRPFLSSICLYLLALLLLATATSAGFFGLGASLLTFGVGLGLPYAVAEVARLDNDGRYVILSVPAIGIGAMIGPGIGGTISQAGSYLPILIFAAATMILSATLFLLAPAADQK